MRAFSPRRRITRQWPDRSDIFATVQVTNNDRWFLVQVYRWFPSILSLRLSDMKRWCGGIGPAFVVIGVEIELAGRAPANTQASLFCEHQ